MFARAHSELRGTSIFAAQTIEARCRGVRQARVELHFGGFTALKPRGSERGGPRGQFEVVLIGGKLGAAACVGHSIFELRRKDPETPPQRIRFEEKAERIIGMVLLHSPGRFRCAFEVKGIDFVKNGMSFGRREAPGTSRVQGNAQQEQTKNAGPAARRKEAHQIPSRQVTQGQALRCTSLSRSRRVANRNGFWRKAELGGSCVSGNPSA